MLPFKSSHPSLAPMHWRLWLLCHQFLSRNIFLKPNLSANYYRSVLNFGRVLIVHIYLKGNIWHLATIFCWPSRPCSPGWSGSGVAIYAGLSLIKLSAIFPGAVFSVHPHSSSLLVSLVSPVVGQVARLVSDICILTAALCLLLTTGVPRGGVYVFTQLASH